MVTYSFYVVVKNYNEVNFCMGNWDMQKRDPNFLLLNNKK